MANKMNTELGLDLTPFEKSLVRLQKRLGELSRNLEGIGQSMTQNLTLPILGIGAAAVKSFADFDKLERGLTAVMGTSEAAAAELEKLKEAARAPGLGFEEAVRGSIRLQAVGLSADEARGTLQAFGAAIAATGGTAENLESVQYQLTQMISKNRILQEDFGILQENVPLLGKAVQQAFGTANIEQIRATGISAQDFNKRLVEALQSLPEVQKATGGLGNAFDNFTDSVKFSLGELGRIIAETINLEGILNGLSDALAAVAGWFKQLNPGAQKFIIVLAGILAAIGPLLLAFSALSSLAGALAAGFAFMTGPIGLAIVAVGALIAVFATANTKINEAAAAQKRIADISKKASDAILAEQTEAKRLVDVIKDDTTARQDKLKALNELQKISPQYFKGINTEKGLVEGVTKAYEQYSAELLKSAKIQVAKENLVELERQLNNVTEAAKPTVWQGIGIAIRGSFNGAVGLLGTSFGTANEYAKTFLNNVDNTTKSLKAQRDATVKLLAELTKGGTPTPSGDNGGGDGGGGGAISKEALKAAKDYEIFVSNITSRISGLAQRAKGPFGFIRADLENAAQITPELNKQKDALIEYQKSLRLLSAEASLLGENPLPAQLSATKSALSSAVQAFGPASDAVRVLADEYDRLNFASIEFEQQTKRQQEALEQQKEVLSQYTSTIASGFDAAAAAVSESGLTIASVLQNAGRAALKAASDFLRAKIIESVAAFIADSFKKFGVLGAVVGAAGGAVVGSLFTGAVSKLSGLAKLAKGGLAFGPTTAIVGDNPAAKTDPEVIAPLSKLKDYLNPGGGAMIAEARISGNDLLILVNNAERANNRIR